MPFQFFGIEGLAPHGTCLLWIGELFWTFAFSDGLIALSYLSISISLLLVIRKRDEVLMRRVGLFFAAFILVCGGSHAMDIWTLWYPDYGAQGLVKLATAIISVVTAILMWPLLPEIFSFPSLAQLEAVNRALNVEVTERRQAEATLAAYADELKRNNNHLQQTLSSLDQARSQLLQSEKMASLGGLVAGIAHEINTPVGNGVTVASSLTDLARRFRRHIEGDAIKRSHLESFAADVEEAAGLISTNLDTAAGLVQSFKQVAADQTSSQRRAFDLHETIDEIVATLRPRFKRTPYAIRIEVPVGIVMESYPGPLGQVITNLVTNSLTHAFQGRDRGEMVITARSEGDDRLRLTYGDDGIGIPSEWRHRIFEPFFTTRQGRGGTGLGLHVVYNIVTNVLGGTIALRGDKDCGVEFILDLPLTAPDLVLVADASLAITVPRLDVEKPDA